MNTNKVERPELRPLNLVIVASMLEEFQSSSCFLLL